MKRHFLIILLMVLVASTVSYAIPLTEEANPHNMSGNNTTGVRAVTPAFAGESSADQICVFCHIPHSSSPKSTLWSRPDPKGPNNDGSFPVYGETLGLTLGINQDEAAKTLTGYDSTISEYPSGASRMCLSCHDGVTSIGVLLDNTTITMEGSQTITDDSGFKMIVDLDTSHPISFNYNQNVITTLLTPAYRMPLYNSTPLDGAGQMQCTTCHDPHDDTRDALGLPFWRLKVAEQDGVYEDVCSSCHVGLTAIPDSPPIHDIP